MKFSIILIVAACLATCGGRKATKPASEKPVAYGFTVVAEYPHDADAYTQGLFWFAGGNGEKGGKSTGRLIEGTGEYGRSELREVELETGRVVRSTALSEDFFGEGAAVLGGNIYQLTWLNGCGFVYDAATLDRTGEFTYKGEGWGLTTDGKKLYMSDGTPNITVRDPGSFSSVERTIVVRNEGSPVVNINELEWIEGKIWANIYTTDSVVIIDPESGKVEGEIDFSDIWSRLQVTRSTDVMNGIAYDPVAKRIFVTGKRWNKLFEVQIFKK